MIAQAKGSLKATAGLGNAMFSLRAVGAGQPFSPLQGLVQTGMEPRASLVPRFALGYPVTARWAWGQANLVDKAYQGPNGFD